MPGISRTCRTDWKKRGRFNGGPRLGVRDGSIEPTHGQSVRVGAESDPSGLASRKSATPRRTRAVIRPDGLPQVKL